MTTEIAQGFNRDIEEPTNPNEFPRIRLMHGIMEEVADGKARPGQYLVDDIDTPFDELVALPWGHNVRRRLWMDVDGEDQVVCSSNDGVTGEGDPGGACNKCSLADWDGNSPPACEISKTYLMWLPEQNLWAQWMLRRTALRTAGKTMNQLVLSHGWEKFAVRITSVLNQPKKGAKYQIPRVEFVKLNKSWLPPTNA